MASSPGSDGDPIGFNKADTWRNPLRKPASSSIFVPKSKPITKFPTSYRQPSNPVTAPKQFSSLHPGVSYPAVNAVPPKPKAPVQVIDVDSDDSFDPDTAIRAEQKPFGAPDPYAYIDAEKASDNIKNLIEGAFDDDEDKSRTRLRRRARKAAPEKQEINGLAARLAALDVKKVEEPVEAPEDEMEDGTVEGLTIKLLPHQVDGVGWMIDRELGTGKRSGAAPKGGILADDMGLGKTVQSVALMLTNARPALDAVPENPRQKLPGKEVSKCTLVVAPLALIKQWESEIKTKVAKSHALKVLVHHGPSRTRLGAELQKYDVVITTYQTLTSEHAGSQMHISGGARVGCFGVHWYRIMLDEAHSIKNRNAKSTQACYALNSMYRWCLTGTPMQNNLDELQSLIQFLRIKPYCYLTDWKSQIIQPMKSGRGGLAMSRLRFFLKAIMKRRTKDLLKQEGALNFGGKAAVEKGQSNGGMNIVKREIITVDCEFDEVEAEFYGRLEARTDQRLQDLMEAEGGNQYIDALVLLLRLRQACNHPQLVEMSLNKDKDAMTLVPSLEARSSQQSATSDDMDDLTALMGGVSVQNKTCDVCQIKLSAEEARSGAVRCEECDEAINASKKSRKRTEDRPTKPPAKPLYPVLPQVKPRNRRIIDDSDDEDDQVDAEGEWIAKEPEHHIELGHAGGSDDEDAEGGGETLNTIDSERSDDDDSQVIDSPGRARRLENEPQPTEPEQSDDDSDSGGEAQDDDESDSDAFANIGPSGKTAQAPSSKIRHILRILHRESRRHKTIVFSQFTTMLDLIEPHLRATSMRFVRYDGSMRPDARERSLHALRTDPRTRTLLCSLKCGSLGLNLTAASRVIIVEPFWNPFVEEQAIDRVHRLNQTVDVKVYRLTVPETVEERIFELQEKKRALADMAIEGGDGTAGKLSMQDVLGLFRRDAEHEAPTEEDRDVWERIGGDRLLSAPSDNPADRGRMAVGDMNGGRSGGGGKGKGVVRRVKEHEVYGRRW